MIVRNHFAILRNLRNIVDAGVSPEHMDKVRRAFDHPSWSRAKLLPFRFVAAARYAPSLEDVIEKAMFKSCEELETLPGKTGLLIDVSGSMEASLSDKSEMTRIDAAAGLAILIREKCEKATIGTFSDRFKQIASRRGFALRDAINSSQPHGGTYLDGALKQCAQGWKDVDRFIVITDEQAHDGMSKPFCEKSFCVNVAPYQRGLSYGNGWSRIDGWSERVVDFIRELEQRQ